MIRSTGRWGEINATPRGELLAILDLPSRVRELVRQSASPQQRSGWNIPRKSLKSYGTDFLVWNMQSLVSQGIAVS